jgi:hypothetical protein
MRDVQSRDDGLRRVSRITRLAAAAGVGASVVFAAAVAHAAPGRSVSSGSTSSMPTGGGSPGSTSSTPTGAGSPAGGPSSPSGGSDLGAQNVTPADPGLQTPAEIPTPTFSRPQVVSGAT